MSRFIAVSGGSGGHIRSKAADAAPSLPPLARKRNAQTHAAKCHKARMFFARGFIFGFYYPDLALDL
ncbi:hypothetical protein [Burkholderia sp. L27(2015)]|uniref:hypothetical protein n=1 Tax=Burkholderia sp. L27(2015) TaxID=1641858 RepID=UPI00131E224B|nr:hypothetical protein [Burkholderia sp. L27(2015)]